MEATENTERFSSRYEEEMEATSSGYSIEEVIKVETAESIEEDPKKDINQFLSEYEIKIDKPLSHLDTYAFITQVGRNKGREELNKILEMCIGKSFDTTKVLTKNEMLQEVIYPIKKSNSMEEGKELEFKTMLTESLKSQKEKKQENSNKYDPEDIKNFYLSYEINPAKSLGHNDVYAFLNQKGPKSDIIELVKNLAGKEIKLDSIDKKTILTDVIYPIKESGKEHEFKTFLKSRLLQQIQVKAEIVQAEEIEYPTIDEVFTESHTDKLMRDLIENPMLLNTIMNTSISNKSLKSLDACVGSKDFAGGRKVLLEELADNVNLEKELKQVFQKENPLQLKR